MRRGIAGFDPRRSHLALQVLLAGSLTLLIAGPWLAGGYIFATDWPGPRQFRFPSETSSSALLRASLATVSSVISGQATGKVFVFGLLFLGALLAYRAIPTGGFVARAAGATVYLFNPFVYDRLQYGQLFLLAGYAVLPWVALRFRLLLVSPRVATALIAAVAMTLLGILSLHLFLVAAVLAGALLVTHMVAESARLGYWKQLGPVVLLAVGVTFAASAYWVIPLLGGRGSEGGTIAGIGAGDLSAYATVPDSRMGLLPNLVGLYGFWAEDTGRFASMKDVVPLWPAALGLLLLVGGIGAVAAFTQRRDRLAPWVAALLVAATVALVLEMGVSNPLTSGFTRWLDDNFTVFRGMRDAGKWAALLALVYSQLVGLGAVAILDWWQKRPREATDKQWLRSTSIGLFLALPLYYGNGLLYGTHGKILPSQYPPGWYSADQVLAADRHPGRTLFLPWHEYMSLSFVRNENSVLVSPAPSFFSTPVLVSSDPELPGVAPPSDPDQTSISALVAAGSQGRWDEALAARNVKYVLLAREADWITYQYLDSQPGLVKVGDFGSMVLYRNTSVP